MDVHDEVSTRRGPLAGKVALVTGAGRNIGRAIAEELAAMGADVIVNARRNRVEAEETCGAVEQLGVRAICVMGDASRKETVEAIRSEAEAVFGGVDISVSAAARRLHKTFFETSDDDWFRHLNMQLTASWYLAKAFTPHMMDRGWGRIIHINGLDGLVGGWDRIPHAAGKGGLRNLTRSLAAGLGEYGITVNDVYPGFTKTVRDPESHPQVDAEFTRAYEARLPIRRQPTPEEVAWAVGFLCSPRSGAITGSAIHVDGGEMMRA